MTRRWQVYNIFFNRSYSFDYSYHYQVFMLLEHFLWYSTDSLVEIFTSRKHTTIMETSYEFWWKFLHNFIHFFTKITSDRLNEFQFVQQTISIIRFSSIVRFISEEIATLFFFLEMRCYFFNAFMLHASVLKPNFDLKRWEKRDMNENLVQTWHNCLRSWNSISFIVARQIRRKRCLKKMNFWTLSLPDVQWDREWLRSRNVAISLDNYCERIRTQDGELVAWWRRFFPFVVCRRWLDVYEKSSNL